MSNLSSPADSIHDAKVGESATGSASRVARDTGSSAVGTTPTGDATNEAPSGSPSGRPASALAPETSGSAEVLPPDSSPPVTADDSGVIQVASDGSSMLFEVDSETMRAASPDGWVIATVSESVTSHDDGATGEGDSPAAGATDESDASTDDDLSPDGAASNSDTSDDEQVDDVESAGPTPSRQPVMTSAEEYDKRIEPDLLENNRLTEVDAQVVKALLDEYLQQLEILGKIITAPYIKDHIDDKETLRQRFRRQEDEPIQIKGTHGDHIVPASPSLVKIQQDRAYHAKVITRLIAELRRESSYAPLVEAVEAETIRRREYVLIEDDAIATSRRNAALQQEIRELRRAMATEITERNKSIFELKDELQEVLARTGMEVRYIRASSAALIASDEANTHFRRVEKRAEAETARLACDYETRVNTEIESYLRDALDELNDTLDARLTKFDVDTDDKERELANLKYQKQQNFQALTEVKEQFVEYTRVIAEDDEELRLEDERLKEEMRREEAAIVIQSFWKMYRELKKLRKKLKKMRKAAKKAKKAGKGGAKSPSPKGKDKKKKK